MRARDFLLEDQDAPGAPKEIHHTGNLIPMPAGTTRVKVSDVYDWYKVGQAISNLKNVKRKDFGQGPPQTVIVFGSEEEEHKLVPLLQKLGLELTDVDEPLIETDAYLASDVLQVLKEKWSKRYKRSIDCSSPKGFSQRAHCAARRKRAKGGKTKSKPV
jgi:hypothetical protein